MPIYVVDGVEVAVIRSFKNEGDSVCERIVNFMNEIYQEDEEKRTKKGE